MSLSRFAILAVAVSACTQASEVPVSGPPKEATGWRAVEVASGFKKGWGVTWLPGGDLLITEKRGGLVRIAKDGTSTQIPGLAPAFSEGQGGLMDVALHPQFARNGLVYFTMSQGTRQANQTTLVRGKLVGDRLENVQTIFRVSQTKSGGQHFGSRILWLRDGTMLMSIGDGGNPPTRLGTEWIRNNAQKRSSHLGKVLRLDENGRAPRDNPFVREAGAAPEVWSYGHRNIQGMALDPASGRVYANEHGARGGDELNLVQRAKNYGWPLATYSVEYSGPEISPNRSLPGMVDPMIAWTPCPAPSGLAFITSNRYPAWRGDLMSGGLAGTDIRRIDLDAQGRVIGQERLDMRTRIRDVRQGPDGFIYALTDEENGRLLRIELTR